MVDVLPLLNGAAFGNRFGNAWAVVVSGVGNNVTKKYAVGVGVNLNLPISVRPFPSPKFNWLHSNDVCDEVDGRQKWWWAEAEGAA
jgi:hypothetical protein